MMIYICSQSRGNPPHSEEKLRFNQMETTKHCADVSEAGHTPIAPHLYFAIFLNDLDPDQRARGMKMGAELIAKCDEMWVFGREQSEGMKRDIAKAEEIGIPVIYK